MVDAHFGSWARADLESGYGPTAEHVAATVAAAVELGVVGGNLEDVTQPGELLPVEAACERLEAARAAAPAGSFVLNAATLRSVGVARIIVGGALTRAVLTLVEQAAREMADHGTFGFAQGAIPYAELQRRFSRRAQVR